MADQNLEDAARELEQATRQVAEDIQRYGFMRSQSEDKYLAAQQRLERATGRTGKTMSDAADNMERAGRKVGNALGDVADAGLAAAGAMYQGQKGAAAFNRSLDHLSEAATAAGAALTLLIPGGAVIKGLVAGLTLLTGGAIKAAKMANEMSDKLYGSFGALNKAGGAAADGMTGVFRSAKSLGLSMDELGALTDAVAGRAQDFALFGGTVFESRKRLADMGDALRENREQFLSLGMSMPDVTEGLADYIALQSRLGNTQTRSTRELAESARRYLIEQDALTKLTGQTRQQQEQANQRALQNEQFLAKVRQLQLSGQGEAAERLLKLNRIYALAGPETQEAFQGIVTGNLASEAAAKGFISSMGVLASSTEDVIANRKSEVQAAQETFKAMGVFGDTVGVQAGLVAANNQPFTNLRELINARLVQEKDIVKQLELSEEEQRKMGAAQEAALDPVLAQQARLRDVQIQANEALEDLAFDAVPTVGDVMVDLAEVTRDAAEGLRDLVGEVKGVLGVFGIGEEAPTPERKDGSFLGADTPKDLAERERALEGVMTDDERLGFQRGLAKDAEGVGRALADFVGLVSDDAGKVIDNIVDRAQKSRVESEQKYLQEKGRAPAAAAAAPVAASGAAAPTGGGTIGQPEPEQGYSERDLRKMGFKIKSGYTQEAGEKIQSNTLELARAAQELPGFRRITGFNDEFHQGTKSQHTQGAAFDFTLRDRPSPAEGRDIIEKLIGAGASKVLDEYNRPSRRATSGHIHVEAPLMARGGITDGVSIAGEAGPEAVVPLPDGRAIPVNMSDLGMEKMHASAAMLQQAADSLNALGVNSGRELDQSFSEAMTHLREILSDAPQTADIARALANIDSGMAEWNRVGSVTGGNFAFAQEKLLPDMLEAARGNAVDTDFWKNIEAQIKTPAGTQMGTIDDLRQMLSEQRDNSVDSLRETQSEFRSALGQIVQEIRQGQQSNIQQEILQTLQSINRNQGRTADASQRMADVAMN